MNNDKRFNLPSLEEKRRKKQFEKWTFWTLIVISILLLFILSGCGSTLAGVQNKDTGTGVLAGVAVAKTQQRIQKALTPDYPLYEQATEVCLFEKEDPEMLNCFIVPCDRDCDRQTTLTEYRQNNEGFQTYDSTLSGLNAIAEFCGKNKNQKEFCIEQLYTFDKGVIVRIE